MVVENLSDCKEYIDAIFATVNLWKKNLSCRLDAILNASSPDIMNLTVSFFILNFCAATQDIAVDGWALTMLSKKNVGMASTCNSVGQVCCWFIHVWFARISVRISAEYLLLFRHAFCMTELTAKFYWRTVAICKHAL